MTAAKPGMTLDPQAGIKSEGEAHKILRMA